MSYVRHISFVSDSACPRRRLTASSSPSQWRDGGLDHPGAALDQGTKGSGSPVPEAGFSDDCVTGVSTRGLVGEQGKKITSKKGPKRPKIQMDLFSSPQVEKSLG
jgi:hypothetical protein